MSDVITIDGLETRCLIGVHAAERQHPQLVSVRLALELDGGPAARSGRLGDTIDYSMSGAIARFVLVAGRFLLVETAVEVLCAAALGAADGPAPAAVTVELTKPHALPGAARVRYQARRAAAALPMRREAAPFGSLLCLFDAPPCRLVRITLAAGATLPAELVRLPGAALLALDPGIAALPAGTARLADPSAGGSLRNTGDSGCGLLLVVAGAGAEGGRPASDEPVDFFARAGHYIVDAGS
jgi:dihydroneopterin aldolase